MRSTEARIGAISAMPDARRATGEGGGVAAARAGVNAGFRAQAVSVPVDAAASAKPD